MREIVRSNQFKKDYKKAKNRGYDMNLLKEVISMLQKEEKLPERYRDHGLSGEYIGIRECHIQPDWLLLYSYTGDKLILILQRTGTHSDIFR